MHRFKTLIPAEELYRHLGRPDLRIFDCRFSLDNPGRGRLDFQQSRIPGSHYLHLDEDLAGPVVPGTTGRHPLPDPERFSEFLRGHGVTAASHVVAYDDAGGSVAARLWWMLQWLGHDAAAVLDGGWTRWLQSGLPVESGPLRESPATGGSFEVRCRPELVASIQEIEWLVQSGEGFRLIDARAPERFRGEVEPIDPVAGHIPGARNHPFTSNLDIDGRFRPPETLLPDLTAVLGGIPAASAICYCGSGVTGAHNVLAFRHAGLEMPRLYPGSWSEWITDPSHPTATGE